jgi:hypothetical protein
MLTGDLGDPRNDHGVPRQQKRDSRTESSRYHTRYPKCRILLLPLRNMFSNMIAFVQDGVDVLCAGKRRDDQKTRQYA